MDNFCRQFSGSRSAGNSRLLSPFGAARRRCLSPAQWLSVGEKKWGDYYQSYNHFSREEKERTGKQTCVIVAENVLVEQDGKLEQELRGCLSKGLQIVVQLERWILHCLGQRMVPLITVWIMKERLNAPEQTTAESVLSKGGESWGGRWWIHGTIMYSTWLVIPRGRRAH